MYSTVVTATLTGKDKTEKNIYRIDCKTDWFKADIKLSRFQLFKRRFQSFFELWLPFLLPFTSRYYPLFEKANRLLKEKNFDLIIATGEPFILFTFAAKLSTKYKIQWVPDYRDNWSNEPTNKIMSSYLSTKYFRSLEHSLLNKTSNVLTVGVNTAHRISEINSLPQIHIIENGHNIPVDFIGSSLINDKIIVTYLGRFYQHRNPKLFFLGLNEWLIKNPAAHVEIRFIGIDDFPEQKKELIDMAEDLTKYIITTPGLPYEEMLKYASESHCFLLLANPDLPLTNGKVYDYLGLKRPILLVPDDKSIFRDLILKERCGYIASTSREVADVLDLMYSNLSNPQFFETPVNREKYSRRRGTEHLAEIIKEICNK